MKTHSTLIMNSASDWQLKKLILIDKSWIQFTLFDVFKYLTFTQ